MHPSQVLVDASPYKESPHNADVKTHYPVTAIKKKLPDLQVTQSVPKVLQVRHQPSQGEHTGVTPELGISPSSLF